MLLGALIKLPLLFSLLLFVLPETDKNKIIALAVSLVCFAGSVAMLFNFLPGPLGYPPFEVKFLRSMGLEFKFGVDGLSMLLVLLTTFLAPLIIYSSFDGEFKRSNAFYGLILLMEMALIGVFTTTDIMLFYIFWEIALIPVFFISALWGGKNAKAITLKFFIYTLVGGLFMLAAIVFVYVKTPGAHSFAFSEFYKVALDPQAQKWLFLAFFLAFAIKIPVFPFHTWQPSLYFTAPTQGTMLMAGIMLKMGVYGLLRFVLPLFPSVLDDWGFYAVALSVSGVVYASIIAIRQDELKKLIAYSSLAHVGLIAAGVFTRTFNGLEGALVQMVSHGVNIVALFYCYEIIVRRTKTGRISDLGGIASKAPVFAVFFMVIMLGGIAFPLTNSFVGEFLLLLGVFEYNRILAVVAGTTIIFGAVYMLWMYQRTMYGGPKLATSNFTDLTRRETAILVSVIVVILWIGIYPSMFLGIAEPAVKTILGIKGI